jgi:hypothetical protein
MKEKEHQPTPQPLAGRLRLAHLRKKTKIENEAFNVMKNHGYELEHNFGHGVTFLAMTLADSE